MSTWQGPELQQTIENNVTHVLGCMGNQVSSVPGKILITGATGTVGQALARRLAEAGRPVRVVSRRPELLAGRFEDVATPPSPGAGAQAWRPLLEGISDVIHCAAFSDAAAASGVEELFRVNALLTGEAATAAAGQIEGKFVFISSIRAVAGPVRGGPITDETAADPQDNYGRSKLAGERCVRRAYAEKKSFVILRPAPIYGGVPKGNLKMLLRLARTPLPLPLAGIHGRRSLLQLDAFVRSILHVLDQPDADGGTFVVSDAKALSAMQMIEALRQGFYRRSHVFALPERLLAGFFSASGQSSAWARLSGSLVIEPRGLRAIGWEPYEDTAAGLRELARTWGPTGTDGKIEVRFEE